MLIGLLEWETGGVKADIQNHQLFFSFCHLTFHAYTLSTMHFHACMLLMLKLSCLTEHTLLCANRTGSLTRVKIGLPADGTDTADL